MHIKIIITPRKLLSEFRKPHRKLQFQRVFFWLCYQQNNMKSYAALLKLIVDVKFKTLYLNSKIKTFMILIIAYKYKICYTLNYFKSIHFVIRSKKRFD